jgi:hypothetical protein
MLGHIILSDNHLMIKVNSQAYGTLFIEADDESASMLQGHLSDLVEGYVVETTDTTKDNIKVNTWKFHIESFETD